MNRVFVTGMGVLSPIGNNLKEFTDSIFKGKSGVNNITYFNSSKYKTQFAAEIKNFDEEKYFDKKEIRKLDKFLKYAVFSTDEAMSDSGIDLKQVNKDRAGVIWASGIGGFESIESEILHFADKKNKPRFSPFFISKMLIDSASGFLGIRYGFRAANYATVSACASSAHAIINAFHLIRMGLADIMICGGSEAPIIESAIGGFSAMKAMSQRNDEPEKASRPFDRNRDGFVIGEGAGTLILESESHAKKRGAKIYAEISGTGMSADAYHMTASHPEGEGIVLSMKQALKEGSISGNRIGLINAHATSTMVGDLSEYTAIKKTFGTNMPLITANKSMFGHLLGASGVVESISSILSIMLSRIPGIINTSETDPIIDNHNHLVLGKSIENELSHVLSNNFGFGGHNTSIIFSNHE